MNWIKVNSINELPQDEVFISLYRGQMCLTQYDDEEGLFYVSRQPAYYLESFSVPKDLNHKFEYYCLLSYPYEL